MRVRDRKKKALYRNCTKIEGESMDPRAIHMAVPETESGSYTFLSPFLSLCFLSNPILTFRYILDI